jgi:Uma2 family endonuclease
MALANVHHFTTDEFLAIDGLPRRVELIEGIICDMSPESGLHAEAQELVLRGLIVALPGWSVVAGGSVRVTESFCPIPDAAVYPRGTLQGELYHRGQDARLIVEVGVATAWSDRSVKLAGYAAGEIEEVWLVVPGADLLTCYRSPKNGRFHDEIELPWPGGVDEAVARLAMRLADGASDR